MSGSRNYEFDISLVKIREKKRKNRQRAERAIILFIVWFLVFKVFGIMRVSGNSMRPAYHSGDIVFFVRILPKDIDYGDVVILKDASGEYLLKRIEGLPGDVIEIDENGYLIRNGENAVERDIIYGQAETESSVVYPFTVPEESYFFLGDNRPVSVDSRTLGTAVKADIKGRVTGVLRWGE